MNWACLISLPSRMMRNSWQVQVSLAKQVPSSPSRMKIHLFLLWKPRQFTSLHFQGWPILGFAASHLPLLGVFHNWFLYYLFSQTSHRHFFWWISGTRDTSARCSVLCDDPKDLELWRYTDSRLPRLHPGTAEHPKLYVYILKALHI